MSGRLENRVIELPSSFVADTENHAVTPLRRSIYSGEVPVVVGDAGIAAVAGVAVAEVSVVRAVSEDEDVESDKVDKSVSAVPDASSKREATGKGSR